MHAHLPVDAFHILRSLKATLRLLRHTELIGIDTMTIMRPAALRSTLVRLIVPVQASRGFASGGIPPHVLSNWYNT